MFAGAVREKVFSHPEVIRRVNADFVPVAVKAGVLNHPGEDAEGRLLQSIHRSAPAPQGICVLNERGQVLDWVLMFDNEESVLAFLDHSLKRFKERTHAKQSVATRRYMRFPSSRLEDMTDEARSTPAPGRHPAGEHCPQRSPLPQGTLACSVVGRALDANGLLSADTVNQEHYAQDRFDVPPDVQAKLAKVLADAGARRVRIPPELAQLCVTYAYLGHLDVRPLENPAGGTTDLKRCDFWVQKVEDTRIGTLLRVEGRSEVISQSARPRNDGASYRHEVQLTWNGFIEMNGSRMTRLLLSGRGTEKLKWRSDGTGPATRESELAHLPAGRPVDLSCEVRYGVIGEPVAVGEVAE